MTSSPELIARINDAEERALRALSSARDAVALNVAYQEYVGRRGMLRELVRSVGALPESERAAAGRVAHTVFAKTQALFEQKLRTLETQEDEHVAQHERLDVTIPGKKVHRGRLHPLTHARREAERIFSGMGFSVATGPEAEDAWHNFDALNIPDEHPARDMWDTLWLRGNQEILNSKSEILNKSKIQNPKLRRTVLRGSALGSRGAGVLRGSALLLRTHTSPVQIRYMQEHQPPFRIIAPGRVYRFEATDATHEVEFWQIEGLMVSHRDDSDPVNAGHLVWTMEQFFSQFFKRQISARLRPSYFPFTEPSFEVDIKCLMCNGKGCVSCSHSGWLEIAGAGMVHPKVFEAVRYNPKDIQGFAFGMGLERLCMMKYKIPDIRLFRTGDLRFLRQF